jgi:hypothetical protein
VPMDPHLGRQVPRGHPLRHRLARAARRPAIPLRRQV